MLLNIKYLYSSLLTYHYITWFVCWCFLNPNQHIKAIIYSVRAVILAPLVILVAAW